MEWHTTIVALHIAMLVSLFIFRIRVIIVIAIVGLFSLSMIVVFGIWIFVYFMEVSTYTREVSFIREGHGVMADAAVALTVLFYCALVAAYRKG